jgi:hypothetical protein
VDETFADRPWLKNQIESTIADDEGRFLLLTVEQGAGKTALMAWLADLHPEWPRYFVRRDSQTPLLSGDAWLFVFGIGQQLGPASFVDQC